MKTLFVAAGLCVGQSVWATVIETVGTPGTGDEWASRKYSTAVQLAPGETYHYTFTNTSYGLSNWNNWLLDIKASADTSVDDWYLTMRSDNHGWGSKYNATMRSADFVWADFKTVMNGATVDMYINYNSDDKIIRTYATITKDATEWHYNFATTAIDAESVYLFLSEELAVLEITTAEKVAKLPDGAKNIYRRSITNGYGYTWDINTANPDYTGWANTGGTKTLDLTDGLMYTLGNAGGNVQTTVSPTIGNIINVEVNFFLKGATGANANYQNYSYFRYGNIYIINDAQYCYSSYSLNGAPTNETATQFHSTAANSSSIYRTTGIDYRLVMEINTLTNMLVSMKVYVNGAVDPSVNISNQALTSYNYTTLEMGYIKGRSSSSSTHKLKDISITETPQAISVVDYTVKFQDALGNTLKADVIHDNGVVGEVYQATAEDLATFYNGGETQKYVYKSGQNTSVVASSTASENVITLVFDVYDKTTYHVNAQAGGSDIKTDIVTGSAFLDGSTTAYWSKYLKVGSQWYEADETTYGAAITNATTNVAYTATDDIDYFFEFEDMSANSAILDALSGTAISGGKSKRFNANGKKWTTALAGGTYTLKLYCNGHNAKSPTMPMYYSDPDGSNEVYIGEATACQASTWSLKTTTNVVIPEGKALCFFNNSSSSHNYIVDYMTLKRTGSATVSATLNSAGLASFSSAYPLDLSGISGATAYYAKSDGLSTGKVTLTEATGGIAAGEGLILKGENGAAVTIPVVATGTSISGNLMVGCPTGEDITSSTIDYANIYVLGSADAQLHNVKDYVDANTTLPIPAGKAYLKASIPSGARSLTISFDDEDVTGVNEVRSQKEDVRSEWFDLQGRKVAQPAQGLYIVNGKKVVIK